MCMFSHISEQNNRLAAILCPVLRSRLYSTWRDPEDVAISERKWTSSALSYAFAIKFLYFFCWLQYICYIIILIVEIIRSWRQSNFVKFVVFDDFSSAWLNIWIRYSKFEYDTKSIR